MEPGETLRHLTLKIAAVITYVIRGGANLRQTVTGLFDSMDAGPVLCTFMQHSITFCSVPEVVGDVISGLAEELAGLDVCV